MTEQEAHIMVQDLTMAYGDFVLMRDLTFTINRGDIFIIMGGSGCGKSTMMTILIGLKTPAKGKIFYGRGRFLGSRSPDPGPDHSPGRGDVPERGALEFHDPGREYLPAAGDSIRI